MCFNGLFAFGMFMPSEPAGTGLDVVHGDENES